MAIADEELRYYSSIGDEEGVRTLIRGDVDLNSRNSMNGWTALHWAAIRGNSKIVEILLENGADPQIRNHKGETPGNLAKSIEIHKMLGEKSEVKAKIPQLPIIPSYLKYPPLPVPTYKWKNYEINNASQETSTGNCKSNFTTNELVLKVRIAGTEDLDFCEIELDQEELTIGKLIIACCDEFNISEKEIAKIRKLPNTVIRKDRDVQRLKHYQEIEIVMCDKYS